MAEVTMMATSLREVKKELDAMRASMVGLTKDSEDYRKKQQEVASLQDKYNTVLKDTKAQATAVDGSLQAMRNQLAELKKYANTQLNVDSDEFVKASERILKLTDEIKALEEKQGTFSRNVGNYANSFKSAFAEIGMGNTALAKSFGIITAGSKGLNQVWTMIAKNPIILILGVLVTVLTKVYKAMMGNKESADKVKQAFAAFRPILELCNKLFSWLGNILADVVVWLAKQLPKALGVFANGMRYAAKVVGFFGQVFGALYGIVGKVLGWIVDKVATFVKWYATTIANVLDAIGLDSLAASMRSVINTAAGYVKVFTDAANNLGNTVKGVFSAIENGMNTAASAIDKVGKAMDTAMKTEQKWQEAEDKMIQNRNKMADNELAAAEKHRQAMTATGQERLKLLNEERELLKDSARLQAQNDQYAVDRLKYMTRFSPTSRDDEAAISEARNKALSSQSAYVKALTKVDRQQIRTEKQMNAASKASAKEREKTAKDAKAAAEKAEKEATAALKEQIKARKQIYDEETKILKDAISREGEYSEGRYTKGLELAKKEYEYRKWYINTLVKDEAHKNELLLEAAEAYEFKVFELQKDFAAKRMQLAIETQKAITSSYSKAEKEYYRGNIEQARLQKDKDRQDIMGRAQLTTDDWNLLMNTPTARKVAAEMSDEIIKQLKDSSPDFFAILTSDDNIPTLMERLKDIDWNSVIKELDVNLFDGLLPDDDGKYNIDEFSKRVSDFYSKIDVILNNKKYESDIDAEVAKYREKTMALVNGGIMTLEDATEKIESYERQLQFDLFDKVKEAQGTITDLFNAEDANLVTGVFGGVDDDSIKRLNTMLGTAISSLAYKYHLLTNETEALQKKLNDVGESIEGVQSKEISNNKIIKDNSDKLDDYNLALVKTSTELKALKTQWNSLNNTVYDEGKRVFEWTAKYGYALSDVAEQNLRYSEVALAEAKRRGKLENETAKQYNVRVLKLEKETYDKRIAYYKQFTQDRANDILTDKGYQVIDNGDENAHTPSAYQRAKAEMEALKQMYADMQAELDEQYAEFAGVEYEQIDTSNTEKLRLYEEYLNKRGALAAYYGKALNQAEGKVQKEGINNQKAYLKTYTAFSAALSSISSNIMGYESDVLQKRVENGQMQQEEAEKEFEQYKTFAKATAIIDMLGGIMGIYMGTLQDKTIQPSWARIPLAATQMASTLAQGLVQIHQIDQTTLGGSTPNGSGAATTTNFSSVGVNPLLDQTADENRIEQAMMNVDTQENRVYILQSDIEKSNNQVKVRQMNSSF